jgi:hypothetical protein
MSALLFDQLVEEYVLFEGMRGNRFIRIMYTTILTFEWASVKGPQGMNTICSSIVREY